MELTSVHQAMQAAQLENERPNLKSFSFRIEKNEVDVAMGICDRHGVSLGAFLRHCIKGLLNDYNVKVPTSEPEVNE